MKKFLFTALLCACLVSCGTAAESSSESAPASKATQAVTAAPTEPVTEAPTEAATEPETSGLSGKKEVIVAGYSQSLDDSGNPIITIYYEFTNGTDEETSYAQSFADEVTQNGTELMCAGYVDDKAVSQGLAPGDSVKVGIIYEVISETAPVEVKLTDLFGQYTYLTETLS